MIPISLYCEVLANFSSDRARSLKTIVPGGIDCVYALVWPDTTINTPANRAVFGDWRTHAGVKVWAWMNAQEDQAATAAAIAEIDGTLRPDGYLLDIEGQWTKGAKLGVLMAAAKATGKPVRCSLAATTSSHVEYDYRAIDLAGAAIEWQSYFHSGEGQKPALTVAELYEASFVLPGWEYRSLLGSSYGWGKVTMFENANGLYDAYKRVGPTDAVFGTLPRPWGRWVAPNRGLYRGGTKVGRLLGRAAYSRIRVALDVTRGAATAYTLSEWAAFAASARVPGAAKRGVAVYNAENCPDDVLVAIAAGATT